MKKYLKEPAFTSKSNYWLWAKGFLETADWFHLARESIRLEPPVAKKGWNADLHLFYSASFIRNKEFQNHNSHSRSLQKFSGYEGNKYNKSHDLTCQAG